MDYVITYDLLKNSVSTNIEDVELRERFYELFEETFNGNLKESFRIFLEIDTEKKEVKGELDWYYIRLEYDNLTVEKLIVWCQRLLDKAGLFRWDIVSGAGCTDDVSLDEIVNKYRKS